MGCFIGFAVESGRFDVINLSVAKFAYLAGVPVLNGSVVTGNTAVYFGLAVAVGTFVLFAG